MGLKWWCLFAPITDKHIQFRVQRWGCLSAYTPVIILCIVNRLRPRQNGRHFADDIFKCKYYRAAFSTPIEAEAQDGRPSASGRHLGRPHFQNQEWGHPRWRPEAEGRPSCASASMGVEKAAPSPGWRHFRRRHLGIKMAAPQVMSGGRRDSGEDVPSSERGGLSPKTSRKGLTLFL